MSPVLIREDKRYIDAQRNNDVLMPTGKKGMAGGMVAKKRGFILAWLRSKIYMLNGEQSIIEHTKEQAAMWAPATPCDRCRSLVKARDRFCSSCGLVRLPTTNPIRSDDVQTAIQHHRLTDEIKAVRKPGERPMRTYNRMLHKQSTGEEEAWIL